MWYSMIKLQTLELHLVANTLGHCSHIPMLHTYVRMYVWTVWVCVMDWSQMKCFLGTSHDHNCKVLKWVSNPTLLGSFQSSQQPPRLPVEASSTKQGAASVHFHATVPSFEGIQEDRQIQQTDTQTYRQVDRWTDGWTDGRLMDGHIDRHTDSTLRHGQSYTIYAHGPMTYILYTAQIHVLTVNNVCKVPKHSE